MSINSPLGRRALASGQAPAQQRVLTVQDESEEFVPRNPYAQGTVPTQLQPQMPPNPNLHPQYGPPPTEYQGVQDMRRAAVAASKQVGSDERDRINYLAGIGRNTIDVDVEGAVFTLRTLKGKEMHQALRAVSQFPEESPDRVYGLRNQLMSRAIYKIDGLTLDLVLGDASPNVVQAYLVEEMDNAVVEYLYSEFLKMHTEQKERFTIKNEADLKEVADNVKKS